MSALQDILDKMYVDPELLEHLDEDQKLLLFIKMREEQVRRWKDNEERLALEESFNERSKKRYFINSQQKRVHWKTGEDGNVWVWVMGEHENDASVEEVLKNEAKEKARQMAEQEVLLESLKLHDNFLHDGLNEQKLKQQLMQIQVSLEEKKSNNSSNLYLKYDTLEDCKKLASDSSVANSTNKMIRSPDTKDARKYTYATEFFLPGTNLTSTRNTNFPLDINEKIVSNEDVTQFDNVSKNSARQNAERYARNNRFSNSPVASTTVFASCLPDVTSNKINFKRRDVTDPSVSTAGSETTVLETKKHGEEQSSNDPINHLRSVLRDRTPNNLLRTVNEAKVPFRKSESNGVKTNILKEFDAKIEKRQSQILEQLLDYQAKIRNVAEDEMEEQHQKECDAWKEQEIKAREAEMQIRLITQKARQEHLKMRTSLSLLPAINDTSFTSLKDAVKNIPRSPKPKNREAIVQWYRLKENGAGIDLNAKRPFTWFHGIISRKHSEELLKNKMPGSYLVRVSERIWGYTISYMSIDKIIKHFLIEKVYDGYQFLGTNQIVHTSLDKLVNYHNTVPITAQGGELLIYPVGQLTSEQSDYADLIL